MRVPGRGRVPLRMPERARILIRYIAHRAVLADGLLGIHGEWSGDDLRPRALAAHPDRGRGADRVDPQAQVDDGVTGRALVLQLQVHGHALAGGERPDLPWPDPVQGPPLRGRRVHGDLLRAPAAGVGEGHRRGAAVAHTDHRGIILSLHRERGGGPVEELALATADAHGDRELVLTTLPVLA